MCFPTPPPTTSPSKPHIIYQQLTPSHSPTSKAKCSFQTKLKFKKPTPSIYPHSPMASIFSTCRTKRRTMCVRWWCSIKKTLKYSDNVCVQCYTKLHSKRKYSDMNAYLVLCRCCSKAISKCLFEIECLNAGRYYSASPY